MTEKSLQVIPNLQKVLYFGTEEEKVHFNIPAQQFQSLSCYFNACYKFLQQTNDCLSLLTIRNR